MFKFTKLRNVNECISDYVFLKLNVGFTERGCRFCPDGSFSLS